MTSWAWLSLLAARAALATSGGGVEEPALPPAAEDPGFGWGVLVRAYYAWAGEELADSPGDVSGFDLEDADLFVAGRAEDAEWRVSADAGDGSLELEDAYARWRFDEAFALAAGQLKPRVVRSGSIPPERLAFRERTFLGAAFDAWDDGFEVGGHYDQFDYWLTVTDGANGSESDHFWSARGEWALYDAAFDDVEGVGDAPNHLRVLLGAFTFEDVAQSSSDAGGYGADLALTFGPWAFHGEWASLGESFQRDADVLEGALVTMGDGDPLSFTLSHRVGDLGELAVRWQRADDLDDHSSVGAAWRAHGGGWPLDGLGAEVSQIDGDGLDETLVSVGIALGTSGLERPFGLLER
jgi:hypothetical protein